MKHNKTRTTAKGILGLAVIATPFFFAPEYAYADAECSPSHCYGMTEYHEAAFDAAGQELWTDCLVLDPWNQANQDFATHEMWLPFPSGKWIESGYIKGGPIAGGDTNTNFRFFWAEYNGTTFSSHYIMGAWITSYVNNSWYRNSNGTWSLYINGSWKGTTTGTYPLGLVVQTGAETSDSMVKSHGKSRYLLTHEAATGNWWTGTLDSWGAHTGVYQVTTNNPYERMEQISLKQICDPLPGGPPGTLYATSPATEEKAKETAIRLAQASGEKNPTEFELVSTTRATAQGTEANNGNKINAEENPDVLMLQMKGNFTGHNVPRPKGYAAPKGTSMTVSLDKRTGEVTDWTLSSKAKDLAQMGPVKKLKP